MKRFQWPFNIDLLLVTILSVYQWVFTTHLSPKFSSQCNGNHFICQHICISKLNAEGRKCLLCRWPQTELQLMSKHQNLRKILNGTYQLKYISFSSTILTHIKIICIQMNLSLFRSSLYKLHTSRNYPLHYITARITWGCSAPVDKLLVLWDQPSRGTALEILSLR